MIMDSPKKGKNCIDIPATVAKNKDKVSDFDWM